MGKLEYRVLADKSTKHAHNMQNTITRVEAIERKARGKNNIL